VELGDIFSDACHSSTNLAFLSTQIRTIAKKTNSTANLTIFFPFFSFQKVLVGVTLHNNSLQAGDQEISHNA
jgi:hypothetical protein